jgi:Putative auto-transporter adhesin, head GIN domain
MATAPTPVHRRHAPHVFRIVEVAAFALLAAAVVVLALRSGGSSSSRLRGSGTAATQTRSLPPFTKVELAGGVNVVVGDGARQLVVVHADDNLLDHVTTRVAAGRLVVGDTGSFTTTAPLSVVVTVPKLAALALSGGGVLDAANLDERTLAVTLSGGGVVHANGKTDRLRLLLSGGGDAELGGLAARDATVRLTGAGRVVVQVTNSLDALVSGAGAIFYSGNPEHVTSNVTGTGAIIPG